MSHSDTEPSQEKPDSGFSVEYDYEIECCGMDRKTVLEVEDVVSEAGIRAEKFAFTHTETSQSDGPMLRLKGLEQETAEDVVGHLRENGITEAVGESIVIVILPVGTE